MTDDADFERRLLAAAKVDGPPRESQEAALAAFLASRAMVDALTTSPPPSSPQPPPPSSPPVGPAPVGAAVPSSALKWLVTGAFLGSLVTLGVTEALRPPPVAHLVSRASAGHRGPRLVAPALVAVVPEMASGRAASSSSSGSAPGRLVSAREAPKVPASAGPASPASEELVTPVSVPSPPVATASRTSRLAEEVVALDAARAKLKSRDYEGALRATDDYRARFPAGELARDVDVVVIEVLSAKGSGDEARARARAFLATYPNDPHASRVRSLAE